MTTTIQPVFTRYLYERLHVKYSLQWALVEKKREEALFWAYELYHSGFQDEVWQWISELYERYYEDYNPRFSPQLDRMYLQWKETGDDCILGTVVGTLAIRDTKDLGKGKREKFIVLYKGDRHKTQEVHEKARNYLKRVTQYKIRQEAKDLAKNICNVSPEMVREAYLGMDWLYYCAGSPVWAFRIREGRGVVDDLGKRVAFESDDDLEAFYERWGFEPDEQCAEMHRWHGIDFD